MVQIIKCQTVIFVGACSRQKASKTVTLLLYFPASSLINTKVETKLILLRLRSCILIVIFSRYRYVRLSIPYLASNIYIFKANL